MSKFTITIDIPKAIINKMASLGIPKKNYCEVYQNYVDHKMGSTYGLELSEFDLWTEESDNITDYVEEK